MPRVERAQPGEVGVGVALELAPVARVGGGQAALDLAHRRLGVARVVPPVRVVLRGLGAARLAGQALGHDARRGRRPRRRCRCRRRPRRSSCRGRRRWRRPASRPPRPRRRWAAARTRAGRCSAAGPGRPRPRRRRPRAPSRRSGSSSPPPRAGRRRPARACRSRRRAARARPRPRRRGPRRREARAPAPAPAATSAKTAPETQAIVAPGGASVLTESQSPTRALERRPGRRWPAASSASAG